MTDTDGGWLTTAELAERLRTVDSTVRFWRATGYGPRGTRIGRRVLYSVGEVRRWEAEQQQQTSATA